MFRKIGLCTEIYLGTQSSIKFSLGSVAKGKLSKAPSISEGQSFAIIGPSVKMIQISCEYFDRTKPQRTAVLMSSRMITAQRIGPCATVCVGPNLRDFGCQSRKYCWCGKTLESARCLLWLQTIHFRSFCVAPIHPLLIACEGNCFVRRLKLQEGQFFFARTESRLARVPAEASILPVTAMPVMHCRACAEPLQDEAP